MGSPHLGKLVSGLCRWPDGHRSTSHSTRRQRHQDACADRDQGTPRPRAPGNLPLLTAKDITGAKKQAVLWWGRVFGLSSCLVALASKNSPAGSVGASWHIAGPAIRSEPSAATTPTRIEIMTQAGTPSARQDLHGKRRKHDGKEMINSWGGSHPSPTPSFVYLEFFI